LNSAAHLLKGIRFSEETFKPPCHACFNVRPNLPFILPSIPARSPPNDDRVKLGSDLSMLPDIAEDVPQVRGAGPDWVWGVERNNSVPFGGSVEWASVRPEASNPDGYARPLL